LSADFCLISSSTFGLADWLRGGVALRAALRLSRPGFPIRRKVDLTGVVFFADKELVNRCGSVVLPNLGQSIAICLRGQHKRSDLGLAVGPDPISLIYEVAKLLDSDDHRRRNVAHLE
jgi:hypothetical protein